MGEVPRVGGEVAANAGQEIGVEINRQGWPQATYPLVLGRGDSQLSPVDMFSAGVTPPGSPSTASYEVLQKKSGVRHEDPAFSRVM